MIREANIKDFNKIESMARAFYNESKYGEIYNVDIDEDSLISFTISFIHDSDKVILFDEDGKGMIWGILVPWFFNTKHMLAQEMAWYVKPEHRNGFTAMRLLKAFEQWAKDKGAKIFVMGSLSELNGDRVGKFYEKNGMKPVESMYGKEL